MQVPDPGKRRIGLGRARKNNRIRCEHGEAIEVQQDYIMGCVPVPVRDRSRPQLCICQEKSTYLITFLQGRATNVLHGVPNGATYEKSLEALEDRFGDQHLAAAYHSQLKGRIQGVRESWEKFAAAI
jgi:hypothetical protein